MSDVIATEKKARTAVGRVTSDKRDKTRSADVNWARRHPKYGKVVRCRTRCQFHDPNNESKMGDLVEIKEGRPVSKTKTWYLVRVIESASLV